MEKYITKGNKTKIKLEVSSRLKHKITKLLNVLMKEYCIKSNSKSFEEAFKYIFKSNLYVLLDNEYHSSAKK